MYGEEVMENNYQLSRIHNYVMGLMSKEEMYEMEREALEDPFLQDAIDGYRKQQGVDAQRLSLLQQRLAKKLEAKAADKKRRFYSWHRLTIGLAAGVLFMAACSLVLFRYLNRVGSNTTETEVILMEEELRVSTNVGNGIGGKDVDGKAVDGRAVDRKGVDAVPEQGWGEFNEELNSELRGVEEKGSLRLRFEVEGGRAVKVEVLSSDNKSLDKVVLGFLDKVSWKGKNGEVSIEVR